MMHFPANHIWWLDLWTIICSKNGVFPLQHVGWPEGPHLHMFEIRRGHIKNISNNKWCSKVVFFSWKMEDGWLPCVPKTPVGWWLGLYYPIYAIPSGLSSYLSLSLIKILMEQPFFSISRHFPPVFRHCSCLSLGGAIGLAVADPAQAPNSARAWWGWRFRGTTGWES